MTYYIDPQQGSNRHDGLCPDTPLKDLSPLAGSPLPPGTEILLRAGSRLTGSFTLTAAGEEKQPVRIASYGGQARPVMDGAGGPYALCLHNSRYVEVEDLELRNAGGAPAFRCGLLVSSGGKTHGGGALRHTVLRRLTIHAVTSRLGREAAGLYITNRESARPCWYEDFLVEDCDIYDTGSCGIVFNSLYGKRPEIPRWDIQPFPFTPATGVVIRKNRVHDLPGDGMWISTTRGALLEYNRVYNTSYGTLTQYAGMWPHNSDGCIMQFNEVYDNRLAAGDGQGLDVDINCNDTLVQYNYSHDNEGGFLLVCTDGDPGNYNRGTVVRYNISRNDGNSLLSIKGIEVTGLQVYNNTFYTTAGYPGGTISTLLWSQNDAVFVNNLFADMSAGDSRFVDARDGEGKPRDNSGLVMTFDNNFFCGKAPQEEGHIRVLPSNRTGMAPGLADPDAEGPEGCRLLPDAVCAYSGKRWIGRGERDFFGQRGEEAAPSIGAHEPAKPCEQAVPAGRQTRKTVDGAGEN